MKGPSMDDCILQNRGANPWYWLKWPHHHCYCITARHYWNSQEDQNCSSSGSGSRWGISRLVRALCTIIIPGTMSMRINGTCLDVFPCSYPNCLFPFPPSLCNVLSGLLHSGSGITPAHGAPNKLMILVQLHLFTAYVAILFHRAGFDGGHRSMSNRRCCFDVFGYIIHKSCDQLAVRVPSCKLVLM